MVRISKGTLINQGFHMAFRKLAKDKGLDIMTKANVSEYMKSVLPKFTEVLRERDDELLKKFCEVDDKGALVIKENKCIPLPGKEEEFTKAAVEYDSFKLEFPSVYKIHINDLAKSEIDAEGIAHIREVLKIPIVADDSDDLND